MSEQQFARAWGVMAWAILIHVLDEAYNNFLVVYNPAAMALTERYPWLPLPVFQFEYWLGGLLAAVFILMALTPVARRESMAILLAGQALALLAAVNGLVHIATTIAGRFPGGFEFARPLPGFWSSPILIAASVWLWRTAAVAKRSGPAV